MCCNAIAQFNFRMNETEELTIGFSAIFHIYPKISSHITSYSVLLYN